MNEKQHTDTEKIKKQKKKLQKNFEGNNRHKNIL